MIFSECAPGYFRKGSWCYLCPFNRIKPQPGDTNECSMQCDFPYALHNPQHTACRESSQPQLLDLITLT